MPMTQQERDAMDAAWQAQRTAEGWKEVKIIQRDMIVKHNDMMQIHEREVAHIDTSEADYTITPAKYQEFLSYFQVIRNNDEALHSTPDEAKAALAALVEPAL